MKKGEHGYINKRKRLQLTKSIVFFAVILVIFFAGYFLNNQTKNNIFTIIAILLVLPATKVLISYIVLLPYQSVEQEKYNEIIRIIPSNVTLLTDLVLTSKEKVMNLSFLVFVNGQVFGVVGREKEDAKYIEDYIKKSFKDNQFSNHIRIFSDYKTFVSTMKKIDMSNNVIDDKLISYFLTLVV